MSTCSSDSVCKKMRVQVVFLVLVIAAFANAKNCTGACQHGDDEALMNRVMKIKNTEWEQCIAAGNCPKTLANVLAPVPCTNGYAGKILLIKHFVFSFVEKTLSYLNFVA